jgi:trypsin
MKKRRRSGTNSVAAIAGSAVLAWIAIIISCISVATASPFERIVGGNDTNPGDYPYFVHYGRCGGVLIANEYVLTAAHCNNLTDNEVLVGAYERNETTYGAVRRKCTDYSVDPNFRYDIVLFYDAAMCKLDKPVYIDDSKVSLVLNEDNAYPPANDNVVAIGMGSLKESDYYIPPKYLQEVTVQVDDNNQCAEAYGDFITEEMVCASVEGGGKDACQGDSGGPLVRQVAGPNGKRIDRHVGIVSWGVGCARDGYPGVYSRTSYSSGFVRNIICDRDESPSTFCNPLVACDRHQLVIRVVTDADSDISWTLIELDGNGGPLLSGGGYTKENFPYEKSYCLQEETRYRFAITGYSENGSGFHSLTLDGIEIGRGDGRSSEFDIPILTNSPTKNPTPIPTKNPTSNPTNKPSSSPTNNPSSSPTSNPSKNPSSSPTSNPSNNPSSSPTTNPTNNLSSSQTNKPTAKPPLEICPVRGACEDVKGYTWKGKTCAQLKRKHCRKPSKMNDGKKVRFYCPSLCLPEECSNDPTGLPTGSTPRGSCDNTEGYRFQNETCCDLSFGHSKKKRRQNCNKRDRNNGNGKKRVRFFCPALCNRKCRRMLRN